MRCNSDAHAASANILHNAKREKAAFSVWKRTYLGLLVAMCVVVVDIYTS